jgi:hypothetical protein
VLALAGPGRAEHLALHLDIKHCYGIAEEYLLPDEIKS